MRASTGGSGRFAAIIEATVTDDEGREYFIHVTPEQIAELTRFAAEADKQQQQQQQDERELLSDKV